MTDVSSSTFSNDISDADIPSSYYALNPQQLELGVWLPRIGGCVTLLCSLCMIYMAIQRRRHLFHRLVLGTSNV